MRSPGYIVETKSGKMGRTFNSKGLINNKVPVYLADGTITHVLPDGDSIIYPLTYSDKAILCSRESLKFLGHID